MKFCPKCGSMILPKKGETEIVCQCGYTEKVGDYKIAAQHKHEEVKDVEVMEQDDSRLPVGKHKCEKCGNDEAYHWEIQTRASDEPPTRFYKCTKCKTTWREYS